MVAVPWKFRVPEGIPLAHWPTNKELLQTVPAEDETLVTATKRRTRHCRRKELTLEERLLEATRNYLAACGVNWGRAQWLHSRPRPDAQILV